MTALNKNNFLSNIKKPATADLVAGLSIIGLLIPEAIAYAHIAGMPARSGLVALLAGLFVYGLFGKSRFAIVSATSAGSAVLLASLNRLIPTDLSDKLMLASVVVIGVGVCFLLARLFRLGRMADFIAKPVLRGVTIGLATVITISQLPHLLGIKLSSSAIGQLSLWDKLTQIISQFADWHLPSLGLGLVALLALFVIKSRYQPVTLWVIVLSMFAMYATPLGTMDIAVVGEISLEQPHRNWEGLWHQHCFLLAQFSMAIALILYAESSSTIHGCAMRHNERNDDNADLLGFGWANIVSGVFGGLPVGAGFSATSANETLNDSFSSNSSSNSDSKSHNTSSPFSNNAKEKSITDSNSNASGNSMGSVSKLSAYVAFVVGLVVMLTCLPLLAWIPEPILSVVVIHAVSHGLSLMPIHRYFQWKRDRVIVLVTVFSVISLGVLNGLMLAIGLSIIMMIHHVSKPKWNKLGRLNGGHNFVNTRYYPQARLAKRVLVFNIGEPLFFANVTTIFEQLREEVEKDSRAGQYRVVVISLEESPDIDGTTIEVIENFANQLALQGLSVYFCRVHGAVREALCALECDNLDSTKLSHLSVDDAVSSLDLMEY